jgi:integrase/recombinase XerD
MIKVKKWDATTLSVSMPYREEWVTCIRQVPGRRWQPESKVWLIPYSQESVVNLIKSFAGVEIEMYATLEAECPWLIEAFNTSSSQVKTHELELHRQVLDSLKLRGYSKRTQKAYIGHIERFLEKCDCHADQLTSEHN